MCKDLDCPYTEIITNLAADVGEIKGIVKTYHRVIKAGVCLLAAYFGIDVSGLI